MDSCLHCTWSSRCILSLQTAPSSVFTSLADKLQEMVDGIHTAFSDVDTLPREVSVCGEGGNMAIFTPWYQPRTPGTTPVIKLHLAITLAGNVALYCACSESPSYTTMHFFASLCLQGVGAAEWLRKRRRTCSGKHPTLATKNHLIPTSKEQPQL